MEPKSPVITTDRLVLRPLVVDDAQAIFQTYATDKEVTRYLTWSPHASVKETEAFVAKQMTEDRNGSNYTWVIRVGDEPSRQADEPSHLIGMITLSINGLEADFGYVLARNEWGKGYMTEALRAILGVAASIPLIKKIWAVCDIENLASARVMQKAGLKFEGIRRRFIVHPNISSEPRDVYCYYIEL